MKAFILLPVVVILLLFSCTKGEKSSSVLFGKWEVRKAYGGNINPPDSTYVSGNGNIMQFNSDSTYIAYTNHKQSAQGVFHIYKNVFKTGSTFYDELSWGTDTAFRSVIIINNNFMTIKPLIPDLRTFDYQKIQINL
jgi:hypothetical protein